MDRDEQRAFKAGVAALKDQHRAGVMDYEGMVEVWERAARDAPSVGEAFYNLGVALQRSGKTEEAASAYGKSLKLKPSLRQSAENLAVLKEGAGKIDAAARIYQQILRVYPEDASARARLAELLRLRGDLGGAETLAKEALARKADTPAAYEVLMRIELSRKHAELARLLAQKAQKLAPDRVALSVGLARADLLAGREFSAGARLRDALKKDPSLLEAELLLAIMARSHQDWVGMNAALQPLLKARPKWVAGWIALGVGLRGQGKPEKAKAAYGQALSLDPKSPEAHFDLGILYARALGNAAEGLKHFKQFVALSGGLPPKHPVRGLIKEAEQAIAMEAEAARMEAEAAVMEVEAKKKAAKDAAAAKAAERAKKVAAPTAAADKTAQDKGSLKGGAPDGEPSAKVSPSNPKPDQ